MKFEYIVPRSRVHVLCFHFGRAASVSETRMMRSVNAWVGVVLNWKTVVSEVGLLERAWRRGGLPRHHTVSYRDWEFLRIFQHTNNTVLLGRWLYLPVLVPRSRPPLLSSSIAFHVFIRSANFIEIHLACDASKYHPFHNVDRGCVNRTHLIPSASMGRELRKNTYLPVYSLPKQSDGVDCAARSRLTQLTTPLSLLDLSGAPPGRRLP